MIIKKITDYNEGDKILTFIGKNFFSGDRLDRFIHTEKTFLSLASTTEFSSLLDNSERRITELWGVFAEEHMILGGMTLNYFLWENLSPQLYFQTFSNPKGRIEKISVKPFGEIVSQELVPIEMPQIAIELGYFTVDNKYRGQGIGRQLFSTFINQAEKTPIANKLAFTITLGKYSKTTWGDTLMKRLLSNQTEVTSNIRLLKQAIKELGCPHDIFRVDDAAALTSHFAQTSGFVSLGFGKHLGHLWGKLVR
jgi:GNAT superfamily N-acetyltransferase